MGDIIMEEEQKSYIYIEFEEINSNTTNNFTINSVSPFQMFAMAKYLEYKGQQMLAQMEYQQMQKREEQKIVVPKPKIEISK